MQGKILNPRETCHKYVVIFILVKGQSTMRFKR